MITLLCSFIHSSWLVNVLFVVVVEPETKCSFALEIDFWDVNVTIQVGSGLWLWLW